MAGSKSGSYYDGFNQKLFSSITREYRHCLEIGCAHGNLAASLKQKYPNLYYVGVDISQEALSMAANRLDLAVELDIASISKYEYSKYLGAKQFDLIILGDVLEHIPSPGIVLEGLKQISTLDAELRICIPNMTNIMVLERLVSGDFGYDEMGILDNTHLRFYSPSLMVKDMLDAGWLPNMLDAYSVDLRDEPHVRSIINAACQLGVPPKKAIANLATVQTVFSAVRHSAAHVNLHSLPGISVIVPVNKRWQYEMNISRSPGLKDINAEIIPVFGARNAAEAYEIGAHKASYPWRLFVHQDVYVPKGCGALIAHELIALEATGSNLVPIGFIGGEIQNASSPGAKCLAHRGLLVDRVYPNCLRNNPPSSSASTLDELAILLHADSPFKIDPSLGWHTWATDLCLQAEYYFGKPCAKVLRVPLFHNSLQVDMPEEWGISARVLAQKWPLKGVIHTLCGLIQ